jgi:hypothetical protein
MRRPLGFLARSGVLALFATATSSAALAVAARWEGRGALQPVNATSHWLNGDAAGAVAAADLRHTGVGFATHAAATLFWATLFEAWLGRRPRSRLRLGAEAAAMSALAALVDYRATPKRFTPGWELVLSRRSMAFAYAGMAAGLAAGVRATRFLRD